MACFFRGGGGAELFISPYDIPVGCGRSQQSVEAALYDKCSAR